MKTHAFMAVFCRRARDRWRQPRSAPDQELTRLAPRVLPRTQELMALFWIFLTASAASAQPNRITSPIDPSRTVTLKAHVHPKARPQYDTGPVDPSFQIAYATLSFNHSPGQQAALDLLLAQQQNRASPNHHRWLPPEQYADRFGMSPADIAAV